LNERSLSTLSHFHRPYAAHVPNSVVSNAAFLPVNHRRLSCPAEIPDKQVEIPDKQCHGKPNVSSTVSIFRLASVAGNIAKSQDLSPTWSPTFVEKGDMCEKPAVSSASSCMLNTFVACKTATVAENVSASHVSPPTLSYPSVEGAKTNSEHDVNENCDTPYAVAKSGVRSLPADVSPFSSQCSDLALTTAVASAAVCFNFASLSMFCEISSLDYDVYFYIFFTVLTSSHFKYIVNYFFHVHQLLSILF